MEKTLSLFCSVILLGALGSGCGTTGNTSHFVLALPTSGSPALATINVASVDVETNAAHLGAVNVFPWGRFDTNDLTNIERSLRDTLSASVRAKPTNADSELRIHFVIRRN